MRTLLLLSTISIGHVARLSYSRWRAIATDRVADLSDQSLMIGW
jgi:hypothetical protein